MSCHLEFSNGSVAGRGSDSIGAFIWRGSYEEISGTVTMTKSYVGMHSVAYFGHGDENGIWGTWSIGPDFKGGFHIWISNGSQSENHAEDEVEELLQRIVEEQLTTV